MDPVKQQMTRAELIEFVNDMAVEAVRLRMSVEALKKRVKLAEDINDCQQRTIRELTEEKLQSHYG